MPSIRLSVRVLFILLATAACGSVQPSPGSDATVDAIDDAGPPIDAAPPIDAPPELPPTAARQLSVLSGRVTGGGMVLDVEVSALPAVPVASGGTTLRRVTPIAP